MATKKAATKKAPAKKASAKPPDSRAVILRTEPVAVRELKPYYQNARIGNPREIAKSLHINGQYKPIIVNIGTHTGRPMEVLVGNHTLLGAREEVMWQQGGKSYHKEPMSELVASFVDVDDERAARINIVDNKSADDSQYDENILAEQIANLPDSTGLGITDDVFMEMRAAYAELEDDAGDADFGDIEDEAERKSRTPKFEETPLGDEDEAEDDAPKLKVRDRERIAEEQGVDITKVSSVLPGAVQLAEDPVFDFVKSVDGFDIPRLLNGKEELMQPEDVPDKLKAWAGSATRDLPENDDPDHWWLYNYGVDSTSGMKRIENSIVSFFTWDDYFEAWWDQPAKFVSKVLNSKIKYIATPDFSDNAEMGNLFTYWQLYRARYLSRYFQEAGLKLLPHVIWPDGDLRFLEEVSLHTLPDDVPVLLMQAQTIDPKNVKGGMDHYKRQMQTILDYVRPEIALVYCGKPGREVFESLKKPKNTTLRYLEHRQTALSEQAKKRTKKTGL